MIELTSGVYVAPEHVVSMVANARANHIEVRLTTGDLHYVKADYGNTIYATHDRLVKLVNDARRGELV